MATILVTRVLPGDGLTALAGHTLIGPKADDSPYTPAELLAIAPEVDAIVSLLTDAIDAPLLQAGHAGKLKMVANVAVGYNNIDTATAKSLGIMVSNTPGVLDETTADTAFLLILSASRLADEASRDLRAGRWPGWGINQYLGQDVHGATLGIVGYGRIGQAVARRAVGFGMRVLHHSRNNTRLDGYTADLDGLIASADIISVHTPLTPETTHLIDARRLALMQPHAVLVNTARGPVVDEAALAEALHAGQIFAAGLDVFEREPIVHERLLTAPRTVLLPHIGSGSTATRHKMVAMACESVAQMLRGETPANLVA